MVILFFILVFIIILVVVYKCSKTGGDPVEYIYNLSNGKKLIVVMYRDNLDEIKEPFKNYKIIELKDIIEKLDYPSRIWEENEDVIKWLDVNLKIQTKIEHDTKKIVDIGFIDTNILSNLHGISITTNIWYYLIGRISTNWILTNNSDLMIIVKSLRTNQISAGVKFECIINQFQLENEELKDKPKSLLVHNIHGIVSINYNPHERMILIGERHFKQSNLPSEFYNFFNDLAIKHGFYLLCESPTFIKTTKNDNFLDFINNVGKNSKKVFTDIARNPFPNENICAWFNNYKDAFHPKNLIIEPNEESFREDIKESLFDISDNFIKNLCFQPYDEEIRIELRRPLTEKYHVVYEDFIKLDEITQNKIIDFANETLKLETLTKYFESIADISIKLNIIRNNINQNLKRQSTFDDYSDNKKPRINLLSEDKGKEDIEEIKEKTTKEKEKEIDKQFMETWKYIVVLVTSLVLDIHTIIRCEILKMNEKNPNIVLYFGEAHARNIRRFYGVENFISIFDRINKNAEDAIISLEYDYFK